jgi:hypothetical protein
MLGTAAPRRRRTYGRRLWVRPQLETTNSIPLARQGQAARLSRETYMRYVLEPLGSPGQFTY